MTPRELIGDYRAAAEAGILRLQWCKACRRFIHYPRVVCPHCRGCELEQSQACGRGIVYSFSVVHQPPGPRWTDRVPYVLAVITLDEGVRLMANVIHCDPARVHCDMPVRLTFERRDGRMLPQFEPAPSREGEGE